MVTTGHYTTRSLRTYVLGQKEAGRPLPVFFLDEATSLKGPRLRYLRSVFRTVGLLVVLMGTDSTAANLVGPTSTVVTRGTGSESVSCHMVTRLPRCTEASRRRRVRRAA